MRIEFHALPLVEGYEYWCYQCKTLNLAFVPLKDCPVCQTEIKLRGAPCTLNMEELMAAK